MRRRSLSRLWLAAMLGVVCSCDLERTEPAVPSFQDDPEHACEGSRDGARACQITRRGQRIGGPSSVADVGDYLLENDQIRVAMLAAGNSAGPGLFGGAIVDADIVRPSVSGVVGEDRFAEIFPIVNFAVPGDPSVTANGTLEPFNDGVGPMRVEVLCPGDTCPEAYRASGAAVIRVTAKGASLISALDALRLLSVQSDLSFQTDYVLEPGRRWVRMHTEVINDKCRDPDLSNDEIFASPSSRTTLEPIAPGVSPFDIMLGDSLRFGSGEPIETAPGIAGGDFLLFGPKLSLFTPGFGYGTKLYFLESFERRVDTLGDPPMPDYMAGVSGHVSYGYFSAGPIQIPILTGSFTAAFSGERRLPYPPNPNPGDECAIEEYASGTFAYDRYFVVGDGDAGSIARARLEITGQPFGTIGGNVLEAGSLRPHSGADVLILRDPDPSAPVPTDIRAVMDANRAANGNPGVVLALKTDRGLDHERDGSFDGPVPPGTYLVVARTDDVPPSAPVRVVVNAGETVRGNLLIGLHGAIRYRIVDERGAASPGKLTILDDDLGGASACATAGLVSRGSAARSPRRYVELGDGELPDGITRIVYTTTGEGQVQLSPGRYEVIASRGIERGIDRQCVTVAAGSTEHVTLAVPLEVDSPGWISGDFHVHGQLSFDSSVPHEERVRSAVGEGLELFASTDHDWVGDLGPTVRAMQLEHLVATLVGIETTTLETGHYIGFPLRFDATRPEGGAVDWSRRDACLLAPTGPLCTAGPEGSLLPLTPAEIFSAIRDLGSLGPSATAVLIPHPRDGFFGYFDQFVMSPYDLAINEAGFLSSGNPLLRRPYWSRGFDAIEIMNGKRYELLRTPTAGEVSGFADVLEPLIASNADASIIARAHEDALRGVLVRTPEEQEAIAPLRVPGCLTDDECAAGERCDRHRQVCADNPPCVRCPPEMPDCERCPAGLVCDPVPARCVLVCADDSDCRQTEHCGAGGLCLDTTCLGGEPVDRVCPEHEGTIDDWFRLLNYGVRTAALGNSDTHDLHEIEIGMPRNFVRVGGDTPITVEGREVAEAVRAGRAVASMGPFVELLVANAPIGETTTASGSIRVHVRVQTPDWFGIDRVEVYRNGVLVHVADESTGLVYDPATIVDYDDGFDDEPGGDAWYVAIALATGEGRGLAPVYTSNAHPSLGLSQVAAVAFAGLPSDLLMSFLSLPVPVPEINTVLPYAVTNPVWVDADGDGRFTPPNGAPPWPDEAEASRAPLTSGHAWTRQDRLDRAQDLFRRYFLRALETGHR